MVLPVDRDRFCSSVQTPQSGLLHPGQPGLATCSGKVVTWDEALNSNVNLMPETLAWDAMPKVLPNAEGYYPFAIPGKTKVI